MGLGPYEVASSGASIGLKAEVNAGVDLVKRETDRLGNEFDAEGARHTRGSGPCVVTHHAAPCAQEHICLPPSVGACMTWQHGIVCYMLFCHLLSSLDTLAGMINKYSR